MASWAIDSAPSSRSGIGMGRSGRTRSSSSGSTPSIVRTTPRNGIARRIRGYAGRDQELRRILAELENEVEVMAAPMMEMERKQAYYESANVLRSRAFDGSAVKARPGPDRQ